MILTPVLVLRARSIREQVLGLLLPLVAYTAVFIFALSRESGLAQPMIQFSIGHAAAVAGPLIGLIVLLAAAAAVYIWISAQPDAARPA